MLNFLVSTRALFKRQVCGILNYISKPRITFELHRVGIVSEFASSCQRQLRAATTRINCTVYIFKRDLFGDLCVAATQTIRLLPPLPHPIPGIQKLEQCMLG